MATDKWKKENNDRMKKYRLDYYYRNRDRCRRSVLERKNRIIDVFRELKAALSCSCGQNHPATLQFHHRDAGQKVMDVAVMIRRGWSVEKIKEEIEKCDILCANCHAILHYQERYGLA